MKDVAKAQKFGGLRALFCDDAGLDALRSNAIKLKEMLGMTPVSGRLYGLSAFDVKALIDAFEAQPTVLAVLKVDHLNLAHLDGYQRSLCDLKTGLFSGSTAQHSGRFNFVHKFKKNIFFSKMEN